MSDVFWLLAVDPGGVRNGYAIYHHLKYTDDSQLYMSGTILTKDLDDWLRDHIALDALVYEDYIIRPGVRNYGTRGDTMQVIGKLNMWGHAHKIPIYRQQSSILGLACKIVGITKPKGHMPDDKSAILHGAYWLRERGWYKSALEKGRND